MLPISKTESIPVAKRESERDDIAAYTEKIVSWVKDRVGHGLTLQNAEAEVREKTRPHCDLNLDVVEMWRKLRTVKAVQRRVPGGGPVLPRL